MTMVMMMMTMMMMMMTMTMVMMMMRRVHHCGRFCSLTCPDPSICTGYVA